MLILLALIMLGVGIELPTSLALHSSTSPSQPPNKPYTPLLLHVYLNCLLVIYVGMCFYVSRMENSMHASLLLFRFNM